MTSNLIGIRAENYKRLELVNIEFPVNGGAFAIMGENEAGKSSTLDAIEVAIAGRKGDAIKSAAPVRAGAASAKIVATFDDIVVTRVFRANGTTAITVTNTDGTRPAETPEKLLAKLYSHVALDPLAFSRLTDAAQVAALLPLIGYDPALDDAERAREYEARTIKGRDRDRLKGELAGYGDPVPGLPEVEVDVAALGDELSAAFLHNGERAKLWEDIRAGDTSIDNADRLVSKNLADIQRLEEQIAQIRADNVLYQEQRGRTAARNTELAAQHAAGEDVDVEPIKAKITGAEATNRAIRTNAARKSAAAAVSQAEADYAERTAAIEAVDARKAKSLAEAQMPVPNLTIDPATMVLTLDGVPFSGASTGVKIRTGAAIAMALNPDLRLIIIRDASLLDGKNKAVIDELATDNGFLVLMEIAGENTDDNGIVLVDGAVSEIREA